MKKIKIITCHNVYNVGASLQAYALQHYIKGRGKEYDVEIIDYQPDYLRTMELGYVGNKKYDKLFLRQIYMLLKAPAKIRFRFGAKKSYDKFTRKYLRCTDYKYDTYQKLKEMPPLADVYIAGSDQIWNPLFANGKDPAFYLEFAPAHAVRASYAASIATDSIPREEKEIMGARIRKLNFVSVREKSTVSLLKDMNIKRVDSVLDPVFLLDRSVWEDLAVDISCKYPYILVYTFDKAGSIIQEARKLCKSSSWKIYSVFRIKGVDRSFENCDPFTFLGLIKNAELVISNSFHATAFSIIFHKRFITYTRKENINRRMIDLLELCGLENRMVDKIENMKNTAEKIEYAQVANILKKERIKSEEYLKKVLNGR